MESFNQNVIKHKTGLLNLAAELGNISKACRVMGFSRDTFYRYQTARDAGGVEATEGKAVYPGQELTPQILYQLMLAEVAGETVEVMSSVKIAAFLATRVSSLKCSMPRTIASRTSYLIAPSRWLRFLYGPWVGV